MAWTSPIYNNAVILHGVHIGKHSVGGSNTVVMRDIPDFSVAVCAPAQVVKKYDGLREAWVASEKDPCERSLHKR
jgi:acetyltransferase-like isoleucine patch superfamily enzyme